MSEGGVHLPDVGPLRDPVMVAAFEGWNDAGDAASGALDHLIREWAAEPLGEIDPEDYYDFQVNRPLVTLVDGISRQIQWPTTRFALARTPARDVVLVRGLEPNMRWRAFCAEILDVAQTLDVQMLVTLGALLADAPHTRPVPVTGTASDPDIVQRVRLQRSSYEGPTGIVGVLHDVFTTADLVAVSFWAAVPHYVAQPPAPKATIALLRRLDELLAVSVPLGELPVQAAAWEEQVDELAAEDSDVAEYVRSLESREEDGELTEASGEDLARAFEDYLRERGSDD